VRPRRWPLRATGHRRSGPQRRAGPPAVAYHGTNISHADAYHPPVRGHLAAIERLLRKVERATYQRMATIFDDWVELTNIMLDQLPLHLREAVEVGAITDWPTGSPAERIAAFERIKHHYPDHKVGEAFTLFSHATGEFLEATHTAWFDWMGQLYMSLELGGRGIGDYYTPWPVAFMMAELQGIPTMLQARMLAALTHPDNVLGTAVGLTGLLFQSGPAGQPPIIGDDQVGEYFTRYLIPAAIPFFEPITVADPACGSGVMLLAAAATVPLWARRYGFVRFFGQDISHSAVQMARAQLRAYGLNGYEATMVQAIDDAGWDKFRACLQAAAEGHRADEKGPAAAGQPPTPTVEVIPREVTGHIAHPRLRRRALAQARPSVDLRRPTREEAIRLLSSRPTPSQRRAAR
jgi:hypothetical protein